MLGSGLGGGVSGVDVVALREVGRVERRSGTCAVSELAVSESAARCRGYAREDRRIVGLHLERLWQTPPLLPETVSGEEVTEGKDRVSRNKERVGEDEDSPGAELEIP